MIGLTLAEVTAVTAGRLSGAASPGTAVTGPVVTDSRAVVPGALFVALPGGRVHGYDFVPAALAAGAVAALVPPASPGRAGLGPGAATIEVDDPLLAFGRLARAVCDRLPELTVVAVTGSSGKTSTKDLLGLLLADLGPTVAPQNSFNNEIGVPVTALRCTGQTRFLVAEMGARRPGNVAYLCEIAPPDLAVVLNVGTAHVGVFGSREAIAATKGEMVEALRPGGVAVLNADDPYVRAMAARTSGRVVLFGTGEQAQVRASAVTVDGQARGRFTLTVPDPSGGEQQIDVALRLHGAHHVSNALAAAAVARVAGMALPRIGELLESATAASRGRMAVAARPDGVVVVDDAYNANPESVAAALRALAAMRRPGARTWAVLGEMLELGETAQAEHAAVGALAARLGTDHLVAVGEGAAGVLRELATGGSGTRAVWVPDAEAGLALLRHEVAPGDVVLVKASRAIGLDRLAHALLADALPDDPGAARRDPPPEPVHDGPVTGAGAARGALGEVSR